VEDDFENLRKNPSQEGEADAYQAPSPYLATLLFIPMSKPIFLG